MVFPRKPSITIIFTSALGPCCSEVMSVVGRPFPWCCLRDADGVRAPEVEHVVQYPDRDGDLGVLPVLGPEPQAVADDALPSTVKRLNQRADVVPGGFTASGIG